MKLRKGDSVTYKTLVEGQIASDVIDSFGWHKGRRIVHFGGHWCFRDEIVAKNTAFVWFEFNDNDIRRFAFPTEAECIAFVDGVNTAMKECNFCDYYVFHSKAHVDSYKKTGDYYAYV